MHGYIFKTFPAFATFLLYKCDGSYLVDKEYLELGLEFNPTEA